jgi:hypothetical protein
VLVGYFNRNTQQELDLPIGPANRIEPGGPDMGQPTHFSARPAVRDVRRAAAEGLQADGPVHVDALAERSDDEHSAAVRPDYILSPFGEIAVGNTPPVLRFAEQGPGVQARSRPWRRRRRGPRRRRRRWR